jgi:hypothetical protein
MSNEVDDDDEIDPDIGFKQIELALKGRIRSFMTTCASSQIEQCFIESHGQRTKVENSEYMQEFC